MNRKRKVKHLNTKDFFKMCELLLINVKKPEVSYKNAWKRPLLVEGKTA